MDGCLSFLQYKLNVSWFSAICCSIISVKAKSFADREIRYTLKAQSQGAGTFNIGPSSGIVKLAKELDFEDLRQPHVYSLIVTATEDSGGFSTSVEVCLHCYKYFNASACIKLYILNNSIKLNNIENKFLFLNLGTFASVSLPPSSSIASPAYSANNFSFALSLLSFISFHSLMVSCFCLRAIHPWVRNTFSSFFAKLAASIVFFFFAVCGLVLQH